MSIEGIEHVTRIQLQTDLGRYEFWADRWELEIADDGYALHLRGRGEGTYAKTRHSDLTDANEATPEDPE